MMEEKMEKHHLIKKIYLCPIESMKE